MLQKVYEVTCDCDEADLYPTMINEVNVVSKVEYAPKYLSKSNKGRCNYQLGG